MTAKPVLIYDGECGFCRLWLEYLQDLLGDSVEWLASQQIGDRFPEIDREEFKRAAFFISSDGDVSRGAAAIFAALGLADGKAWMPWLYRHFPPCRWAADAVYWWIAAHRDFGYWATKYSFGLKIRASEYLLTEALFLRLLGVVYLFAFGSLRTQILGLVGSHGIMPVNPVMQALRAQLGWHAMLYSPSVFWFGVSDAALAWACNAGILAALALLFSGWLGAWIQRLAALICVVLYLSIASVGQPFTLFQWDALLVEAGFLALFAGTPLLQWAYRFLLFRLIFESGCVKLLSGDDNWRSLKALRFHFMTQPLPNPIAWYVHQAPAWLLDNVTGLTLAIEIGCPLLLFMPRRIRQTSAIVLIAFQLAIAFTGNYAFFNLLTIALCVWAFDDRALAWSRAWLTSATVQMRTALARRATATVIAVLMFLGGIQVAAMFAPAVGEFFEGSLTLVAPWQIVNSYGLFAVMTTSRPELIFEGSNDGREWKEYSFRYKPGDVKRALPLVAPAQPRLDWQLWFAAMEPYSANPWVGNFVMSLLQGQPAVLHLIDKPPFAQPPKYIRVSIYDYWFTTWQERRATGAIWNRRLEGSYLPPLTLGDLRAPEN